jgi:predicted transcriptional regulator
MRKRTLRIAGPEALPILAALASENRLAILELLGDRILNVQQISDALGLAQPTVSSHVQRLDEAGLIATSFRPGHRGTQKSCSSLYDEIVIQVVAENEDPVVHTREISMPIGAYTGFDVNPSCGLAHSGSIIGLLDDVESFSFPERMKAKILWFARGHIEYTFPRTLPAGARVTRVDLSAELCSEVAGYDNDWPSDITLWLNGAEVGTWTSPGDFGGERGRLNPAWWQDRYTQFGSLKNWTVDASGTYVDGVKLSNVRIQDLELATGPLRVRIGNKSDARNAGGMTLFGDAFGNYQQDLVLRLAYELPPRVPVDPSEGGDGAEPRNV